MFRCTLSIFCFLLCQPFLEFLAQMLTFCFVMEVAAKAHNLYQNTNICTTTFQEFL